MAGDWLKMRMDLPDDPAVIGIALALDLEEDAVVGKLFRLWSWANRQTIDGDAASVTEMWLDRYVGVSGFAQAMVSVGWLTIKAGGIALPDFDKHNSETAKQRALTARRMGKKRYAASVTKSEHLRNQRREEKSKENIQKKVPLDEVAFGKWWTLWPSGKKTGKGAAKKEYATAVGRICSDKGCQPEEARKHLHERLAAFAKTPKCQGEYCPHPGTWLHQDRYDDDPAAWRDSGSSGSSPLPPRMD
jgi:hypothetical protein